MSKLTPIASDSTQYRAMTAQLLPRGPIWDLDSQPGMRGMMGGLGVEGVRFHNRLVALMREAYPSTATELLEEWERLYGLPLCDTPPPDVPSRQAALAGRVAARGDQSKPYYISLVRAVLGDPEADVRIVVRPYGSTFRAWDGAAWDLLGDETSPFYWQVILPAGTDPKLVAVLECLLDFAKPAETEVEIIATLSAYYESPGGAGDYLEASTPIAARVIFPGPADLPSWSVGYWFEPAAFIGGTRMLTVSAAEYDDDGQALIAGVGDDYGGFVALYNTDSDEFSVALTEGPGAPIRLGIVSNGTVIKFYENGVLLGTSSTLGGTFAARDALRLFNGQLGSNPCAGTIRNFTINNRAHSADEEAALFAAGMRHDARAPFGDDWAGETMPVMWLRAALPGGRITHAYLVEGGYTLSATGFASLPNPEDAALSFWVCVQQALGDTVIFVETGHPEIKIEAGDNDGDLFVVRYDDHTEPPTYATEPVWHLVVLNSLGSEVSVNFDGYEHAHLTVGVDLNGNPVFGSATGNYGFYVANIHYWSQHLTPAQIGSLLAAKVTHDPLERFEDWPGMESMAEWVGNATGLTVANAGTGGIHPLTYSGPTLQTLSLDAPVGRVPNSGSGGTCDLLLFGATESKED